MPVVIGAKAHGFENPIGLLTDCHRRIERFLGVLSAAAARYNGARLNEEDAAAFNNALKYFREAAPRHTSDEEESLFPRLRTHRQAQVRDALEQIQGLEDDHRTAESNHAEVDRLGQLWLSEGQLSQPETLRLRALLTELETLYRAHIDTEDRLLFPAAAVVLTEAEKSAIGSEMAKRRRL